MFRLHRQGESRMYCVILITVANKKEAQKIANSLVEKKLAACVNIVDKVNSIFFWQGKIDNAAELLLIVKSKKNLLPKLFKEVKSLHSYTVPEIIALPIISGYKPYLEWINESVS